MKLIELQQFIKEQSIRLKDYYPGLDNRSLILSGTVKLTEELGELCQEILAQQSLQRKEKLPFSKDNLSQEFADVIITTLILAEWMEVDIETALEHKIEIIKNRFSPK